MDRKWKFVILLAILLFPIAVVVSVRLLYPPRPSGGLTVDRKIQLLRAKSVALGYLENNDYDRAIPALDTLVNELPDEPLGHRNLALALFKPTALNPDSSLSKEEAERLQRLLGAVERMLVLEGDRSAAQFLAGRVYVKHAELLRASDARFDEALDKARRCFQEAARLAPADPGPLWDLYLIEKQAGDPDEVSPAALRALELTRNRVPDNTACLLELLLAHMLSKSPDARMTVEQLLRLLPGDLDTLQEGVKPRKVLIELAAILQENAANPPPRAFELRQEAEGLLRNHFGFVQRDFARLKPHPLEFVLEDFRPKYYADLPTDSEPPVSVRFELAELPGATGKTGLLDALRDDLTLQNAWGTVLLREVEGKKRIEVLAEDPCAAIEPFELEGRFRGFQLADLDLDFEVPADPDAKENIPPDLDLILYGDDGVRLLENRAKEGKRQWVDRTADCKLPVLLNVRWLLNCDVDHDGNLDLVVGLPQGVRILRNRGAWAFEDITSRSTGLDKLETIAAAYGDLDRDGDLDLILIDKAGALLRLDNLRGGRLGIKKVDASDIKATSLSIVDMNNDGRLDLVLGWAQGVELLLADEKGEWRAGTTLISGLGAQEVFVHHFDPDNDGWMDVAAVCRGGQGPLLRLFRNVQGRTFVELKSILPALAGPIAAASVRDMDDDGDLDLCFLDGETKLRLLRNEGGNQNRWLKMRLQSELIRDAAGQGQATKSNYRLIGGTAEIRAGRHYQIQVVTGTITHFGLGKRTQVDTLRSIATNGVPRSLIRPDTNAVLVETHQSKGSCPFLFTWDGERFVLVTDCLWSSALGMKLAHDLEMPFDRQHNYLVIPGDKLKPKNGRYELRFTNELWEVPYLDQVQLFVVDHPADVEVFTNQRIPPNPKEEFRLLTVKNRQTPRSARDHSGRDVLSIINRRDWKHLGGFKRQRYVGLAEPHYLELDLGDLSGAKEVMLHLTGWIWPTDTSGNVAISQDPRYAGGAGVIGGSQPPALLVADGKGGWVTALPMMGFMSGKMQTIAVPLAVASFPAKDYRIRIATSMEIYWDEVFFTVDEPVAEHTIEKLPVVASELRYRGYSRVLQATPTSPFVHDYDDVDPAPRWLPIQGHYVRYGAVHELLHKPDSQYVVMSPGDELSLSFAQRPAPRAGWKRSFIFYGNGWLKDFDMNGSASDHAGPYPFEGMKRYPYAHPERHPHERFLSEYLNRTDDPRRFWDELRPK